MKHVLAAFAFALATLAAIPATHAAQAPSREDAPAVMKVCGQLDLDLQALKRYWTDSLVEKGQRDPSRYPTNVQQAFMDLTRLTNANMANFSDLKGLHTVMSLYFTGKTDGRAVITAWTTLSEAYRMHLASKAPIPNFNPSMQFPDRNKWIPNKDKDIEGKMKSLEQFFVERWQNKAALQAKVMNELIPAIRRASQVVASESTQRGGMLPAMTASKLGARLDVALADATTFHDSVGRASDKNGQAVQGDFTDLGFTIEQSFNGILGRINSLAISNELTNVRQIFGQVRDLLSR